MTDIAWLKMIILAIKLRKEKIKMEKEYRNGVERGLLFCTELATIYTQGDQYIRVFDIFGSNKETELTVEEVWNLADSVQKELIKRGVIYLTGYSK